MGSPIAVGMSKPVLYASNTPNGLKPLLLLEELEIPYELSKINLSKGEQKTASFHEKNLNDRIPVLDTEIDGVPISIAESAAILIHLAETHDHRFFPASGAAHVRVLQWTFFQMSAVGPMFGQLGYWRRREVKNTEAIERYEVETKRVYGVLNEQLGRTPYLAGESYSIADMATVFWARGFGYLGLTLEDWPHVARWLRDLEARPAMQRTLAIRWT